MQKQKNLCLPMEQIESKIRSMDSDLSEKFVVTACEDSLVRLFTIKDRNMEFLTELTGHTGVVTKAVFINQGELIASSDFSGKLIVWKLEGHSFVKRSETKVSNGPIYDIAVRYTDSSFTIFCGCDNGILRTVVFDNNFKATVTEQEIHRYGIITVSCNLHFVATGGLDCTAALISKDNIEYLKHHQGAVNSVALAPTDDEKHTILATCSEDGKLAFIFKEDDSIRTQEIKLKEPCYSLDWSKTGFVLTVGYGSEEFKSYIQGENGEYEEVPMKKVEE
ncbi:uncharacterized protein VICG_01946 [Vittaforma corneae ATCC 50505]|uniref:Uncharacterized protein n=1 Tax=Vittaforma corneae (strain ATCC 50505) TaxID=993615 RepID=L2GL13_VITCO|nr:uncharacterized protein VICG_01946 [Vittaforma corneae ATCC 50505]ELA40987.1 hypothetical protein VICG_01946 [Vittaforma corneae ATCC 50505]